MAACIIDEVAAEFGFTLKDKQKEVIQAFVDGNDVFCSVPTGYGKSLCYSLLPKIFDRLRNLPGRSIVICISPLIALMMDQKEKFISMGILAEFISETHHDLDTVQSIRNGKTQLLYISPESLLNNLQWRDLLLSEVYQTNLVCVAIDEAHCVPKWYVVHVHVHACPITRQLHF